MSTAWAWVTNPAAAGTPKLTYGENSVGTPPAVASGTEFSDANYDSAAASDDNFINISATTTGYYPYCMARLPVPIPLNPSIIKCSIASICYAERNSVKGGASYGVKMYGYSFNASAWVLLDSGVSSSKETIDFTTSSDWTLYPPYVSGQLSWFCWIGANAKLAGATSTLYIDSIAEILKAPSGWLL